MAVGFQVVSPLLAIGAVVVVVRQCRRAGRLTLDAMLVVAWVVAWWHDQLIDLVRPGVLYNAVLVDLGSTVSHVPGWPNGSPRGGPEPILMIGTVYVWLGLAFGAVATAVMRRAQARWPRLGLAGTVLAAYAVVATMELALEVLVIRTELVAYPSTIPVLTLFAGDPRQIPIYAPLLWSAVLTATGALRFFVDHDGRTVVERGVERVRARGAARTGLRLLAVIGFVHATAFAYDLAINETMPWAGHTDPYPTYLAPPE
jgi:hypothetical protein